MSTLNIPIALDRVGNNVFHVDITTAISSTKYSNAAGRTANEAARRALQHLRPDLMEDEVTVRSLLATVIYEYASYPEVCSCCLIQEFTTRLEKRLGRSIGGCFPDKSVMDPPSSTTGEFCVGAPTQHCMFCSLHSTHEFTHAAPPPSPCPSPYPSPMALGLRYAGIASRSASPFPRGPDYDPPESPLQIVFTLSPSSSAASSDVLLESESEIPPLDLSPPPVVPPTVESLIPELRAVSQDASGVAGSPSSPPLYSNPYGLPPPLHERTSPYFYIGGEYIKVKLFSAETRTYLPIDEAGNIILYDGGMYSVRIVDSDGAGGNVTFVWEVIPCYRPQAPAAEEPAEAEAPPPSPALSSCSSLSSDSEPSLASSDAGSDSDSSTLSLRTSSDRSRRSARLSPYRRPCPRARPLSDMGKLRAALPHEDPVDDIVPDVRAISLYERDAAPLLPPPSPVMPSCGWLEPAENFAATRAPGDSLLFTDSSSSEGEESEYAAARYRKTRRSSSPRHNPIARDRRRPAPLGRQ